VSAASSPHSGHASTGWTSAAACTSPVTNNRLNPQVSRSHGYSSSHGIQMHFCTKLNN